MPIAVIGDVHGVIKELTALHRIVKPMVDEVWCVTDLIHRGPDSEGCVRYCRENNIHGIMANHEYSFLNQYDKFKTHGRVHPNPDKRHVVETITPESVDWIRKLPNFHIHDATKTVICHGGMYPKLEWWKQPHNVIRAQLIHPGKPGDSKWWGDKCMERYGKTEEQLREEGWRRWYELWDHEYNVVFGHSVFMQPHLRKNPGCGYTIGIDTGCVFGGSLTAAIIEADKEPFFVSVKAERVYVEDMEKNFRER